MSAISRFQAASILPSRRKAASFIKRAAHLQRMATAGLSMPTPPEPCSAMEPVLSSSSGLPMLLPMATRFTASSAAAARTTTARVPHPFSHPAWMDKPKLSPWPSWTPMFPIESIRYIETHGTGTPVGDPIEFDALRRVFERKTDKKQFCYIGSLKGNIGHPTNAAGVAGLIKAALVLYHEEIPATLHFKTPNPKIELAGSPFMVADKLIPFPRSAEVRRAGVSSFGFGGTNVHVILEEAPLPKASSQSRPRQLLLLSAKTPAALKAYSRNLQDFLVSAGSGVLRGYCLYTSSWPQANGASAIRSRRRSLQGSQPACATQSAALRLEALRAQESRRCLPLRRPRYTIRQHGPEFLPRRASFSGDR